MRAKPRGTASNTSWHLANILRLSFVDAGFILFRANLATSSPAPGLHFHRQRLMIDVPMLERQLVYHKPKTNPAG